jgi:hypothetical protein
VPRGREPAANGVDPRNQAYAIDGNSLTRSHAALAGVMVVAIAVDSMKPFTFAFIPQPAVGESVAG